MKTITNHPQTFRATYGPAKPVDREVIKKKIQEQLDLFNKVNANSGVEINKAKVSTPLGVHSSFQAFDPWPISITSAKGAWMTNSDGRKMLDLSMGFGAMLVGHLNDDVMAELKKALDVEIGRAHV